MSTPVNIQDPRSKKSALVTKFNQLVVAPLDYSTPVEIQLDVINTAFNFIEPRPGQSVVITDIIVSADKSVSPSTPANIQIYGADAIDSLTVSIGAISPQLVSAANVSFIGLNLLVPEGKFVNAKTDDTNINLTVMFYRVPAENV